MVRLSSAAACADHCPFVNRRDARCGQCLSIGRLGHAFDYCFGRYHACAVYGEMLIERRARRGEEPPVGEGRAPLLQLTIHREALRANVAAANGSTARARPHANAA